MLRVGSQIDEFLIRRGSRWEPLGRTDPLGTEIDAVWTAHSLRDRVKSALVDKTSTSLQAGHLAGTEFNPYPAVRIFTGLAKKSRNYFTGDAERVREWNDFLRELGIEELTSDEIESLETVYRDSSYFDAGKRKGALWTGGIAVIVSAFLVYFLQPNGKQEGGLESAIHAVQELSPGELQDVKKAIEDILETKKDSEVKK